MTKVLTHFSEADFVFDPAYSYGSTRGFSFKPEGLWLSDETEEGWAVWCKTAGFRENTLRVKKYFEVDLSKLCVLDTVHKMWDFNKKFTNPIHGFVTSIHWGEVKQEYSGILISPYFWSLRLDPDFMWYYSWDCASACVWDLSVLKEVSSEKQARELANLKEERNTHETTRN